MCPALLRALSPLMLVLAMTACGDRQQEREGLGPRGTALPPPGLVQPPR